MKTPKGQRIVKMEQSPAWHELIHVLQAGQQDPTPEMMDAIIYTICSKLDIATDIDADFRTLIIGLLSQQVLRAGQQRQKLAAVQNIKPEVH